MVTSAQVRYILTSPPPTLPVTLGVDELILFQLFCCKINHPESTINFSSLLVPVGQDLGQDTAGRACLCYMKAEVWSHPEMSSFSCVTAGTLTGLLASPGGIFLHGFLALECLLRNVLVEVNKSQVHSYVNFVKGAPCCNYL